MESDKEISNAATDTRILYFSITLELSMPMTPIDFPFTKTVQVKLPHSVGLQNGSKL